MPDILKTHSVDQRFKLVGLDFGSTTTSALVASARLLQSAASRRSEIAELTEEFRSPVVFTPFRGHDLDLAAIEGYLDEWLLEDRVMTQPLFGGGAIVTGLAARAPNASELVRLVRNRLGDALTVTAEDPCLEAWLAFMGSGHRLARSDRRTPRLNLDVGGGTTNLALGIGREVLRTGSLFVGARHFQFQPGTYRMVRLSTQAQRLVEHLGLGKGAGDELGPKEVDAVLDFYLGLLVAAAGGRLERFEEPTAAAHQEVPFHLPHGLPAVDLTLTGGVGELVYRKLNGETLPSTTYYGDLGIDLARRIAHAMKHGPLHREALLAASGDGDQTLDRYKIPEARMHAALHGLLRHSTQVSGSTLFLPHPEVLPLRDLPILGTLTASSDAERIRSLVELARRCPRGACVAVRLGDSSRSAVEGLGGLLRDAFETLSFPTGPPLVLLVAENLGKVLGGYATGWGTVPVQLLAVDEIDLRDARFVQIGRLHDGMLPVSFYGMNPDGTST